MSETVNDIIGKGFKYEERVDLTTLIDNISGTKVALVGAAHWGPVDTPTQIIKSFKNYFGSEINRDENTKDYSGMTAASILNIVPSCFFTRITDGTDTAASLLLMKLAEAGTFTGAENVQGRSLKVTDANKVFTVSFDSTPTIVTLTNSVRCAAITSASLVATNFSIGDYIEFFVDGTAYQYVISAGTDILCKMTGAGAYDDSYYGGLAGENVIAYIDRLIYALKNNVIGSGDTARIIRKSGSDKVSINSQENGASSSIKINAFPVVFSSATVASPLQSVSSNTLAEDIIDEINTAVVATGAAYVESAGKFELQSLTTGVASTVEIDDITTLDRNADFTGQLLTDAGTFATGIGTSYSELTADLGAWLAFVTGQTIVYTTAVAATAGHQDIEFVGAIAAATATGLDDSTAAYDEVTGCSFADSAAASGLATGTAYYFKLNIDGAGAEEYTFTTDPATVTVAQLLIDIATSTKVVGGAPMTGVTFSLEPATNGTIRCTHNTTGASHSLVMTAGTTGTDLFATLTGYTGLLGGAAGTDGTTYTMDVSINGAAAVTVSVVGVDVPTIADLVNEIATDLGTDAIVALDDPGDLISITSNLLDTVSTITITDVDLISSLTAGGGATIGTAVDGTHGTRDITFSGTGIADEDALCPLIAGTYIIKLGVDGVAGADVNVTTTGVETWKQFVEDIIGGIAGITASVTVGGDIQIASANAGIDTTLAVTADITLATADTPGNAVTFTFDAVNLDVDVAVVAGCNDVAGAAQRFAVLAADAYKQFEVYCKVSGTYTTGTIRMDVFKGAQLLSTKTIVTADITTGYARSTFYADAAGTDYVIIFRSFAPGISIGTLTIDNLFLGPVRATPNNTLLDFLGVKDTGGAYDYTGIVYTGADAVLDMGTLEAVYTGEDGNNLYMVKSVSNGINNASFYNSSGLISRISNFSYTVADDTFFGTLINNDTRLQSYISYTLPAGSPASIEPIANGTYYLNGGTSGIDNITDVQYSAALSEYSNMDVFDVDILCVTGNSTATVFSKIQEICEYRKDCFGIVDPPETVAGSLTGSIEQMINWHNGDLPGLLNMELDSKYLVTYFPWVLVDTDSVTTSEQWMPPSLVVTPAIVTTDREYNQFTPAAGKFGKLPTINDIAVYLLDEDKGRCYDDTIGNNINPIVYTNRQGFFIDGAKTTQRTANSYNRTYVMRVSLFMKRKLTQIVPDFYYLPITKDTRDEFEAVVIKDIMTPLISSEAIKPEEGTDWRVITDPNELDIDVDILEASQGMISVIEWTPIKRIEKIKVISVMKDTTVIVQF